MDEGDDAKVKQLLDSLPDGHGVLVSVQGDDMAYYTMSPERLNRLNYISGVVHIITNQLRPQGSHFIAEVENTMFPPATAANDEFVLHMIKWVGIIWWMATIPTQSLAGVEDIATKFDFKLCPTVPVVFGQPPLMAQGSLKKEKKGTSMEPEGTRWFPIEENTYTVEKRR